jgi:cyclomaltodextrinase
MRKLTLLTTILLLSLHAIPQKPASLNQPPQWAKNVIWYQIFVERFYNGDKTNDPTPETMFSGTSDPVPTNWKITPWTQDWYTEDEWAKTNGKSFYPNLQFRRYGGDLQGVLDKLDYLSKLGITAIYLNPINDAPSLHKYDARNYRHVDINFGPDPKGDQQIMASENPSDPSTWQWTAADKLFLKLIREVHKRGMKIILDYSWNHTGVEFWAFKDIQKNQEQSPYKEWYNILSFDNPATPQNEFNYQGWLNIKSLPEIKKINTTKKHEYGYPYEGNINQGAKKQIFAVSKRWLAPDGKPANGVDGYRLDVADQIPLGFWRDYRKFVKSVKPEAYLVGEIWWTRWPDVLMNPVPYLQGDVFDAVMFYQIYRPARAFFAKTNHPIDAQQFVDSLQFQWNRLTKPFRYAMMDVAATHDSPRLLSSFYNPGKYKYHAKPNEDSTYRTGKPDAETYKRVQLYLIHQFTNIGAPQIWNGDEMGMWGADDPDCRKPLWWPEYHFQAETRTNIQNVPKTYDSVGFNQQHFLFYKKLIQIRKENPVLSNGDLKFIKASGKLLAYKRFNKQDAIIVYFNLSHQAQPIILPAFYHYIDLLTGKTFYQTTQIEPMSAFILKQE